jgi:tripartite-type tricarboxylate transporter receptor subunit TctC
MQLLRNIACVISLALAPVAALAQSLPGKPVRMLVGFPAGGPIDTVARLLAPHFVEGLGRPVIVDNRAGASGIIAMDIVAKAAPDGHTFFFGTAGNLAINPSLYPRLPFDIYRDFTPVSHVASTSSLIYVHPSVPVKTLGELIAHASANAGKIHFSSSGAGGVPHLAGELLNIAANIRTVHVPYKGTAPAFNALLGGEVQFMVSAVVSGLQHVNAGRLRAVATTTRTRLALLPDVPAASETLPGFEVDNWYGLVAPAGTPRNIVARLQAETVRIINVPAIREKLIAQGIEPVGSTPQAFEDFMKSELTKWARVVKSANIRPE